MKKKMLISLILVLSTALILVACSNKIDSLQFLTQEGIAPYDLSEREQYILQSFGMKGNSQIISFLAPKEAISVEVNVYILADNNSWEAIGGGAVSLGSDREQNQQLNGTFTMQLKENYAIDFNINSSGRASYQTHEIKLDSDTMASTQGFLQEFQKIELNQEIPVAFMVYDSGTKMRSYSLQDYFSPEKFAGMDLVQVVTLTFADAEL